MQFGIEVLIEYDQKFSKASKIELGNISKGFGLNHYMEFELEVGQVIHEHWKGSRRNIIYITQES